MPDKVNLLGRSLKGRNRIRERGEEWKVERFGKFRGAPAVLVSAGGDLRWVLLQDDPDFVLQETPCACGRGFVLGGGANMTPDCCPICLREAGEACPCGCKGKWLDHDDREGDAWPCPLCGDDSDADAGELCSDCEDGTKPKSCPVCGQDVDDDGQCHSCERRK